MSAHNRTLPPSGGSLENTGKATCCTSGNCSGSESSHGHSHLSTDGLHTNVNVHKDDAPAHGCACCADPLKERSGDQQRKLSLEQKKELAMLLFSGLIFFAVLIFETTIQAGIGNIGVYIGYAIPYLICGVPVFRMAFSAMRHGDVLNEFTLMCGATIAAVILGHYSEAVGVMLFYSTGEFLQDLATASSRGSIRALMASKPTTANILKNGTVTTMKVEEVKPDDIAVVRVGEKIPLDGIVTSGASFVDQSPLTGESVPVRVETGDAVKAGSINTEAAIEIRVTSHFADTQMARILEMVESAAARKSPTERFITKFARYYTPAVVLAAALIAIIPPLFFGAEWQMWIYRALVLLVISCPCALLISIPLGYFGGIGAASRKGILVKGGNVLDGILHTNTVIFDKTGTITLGSFTVTGKHPANGVDVAQLLQAAALAESDSNHPIARSIKQAAGSAAGAVRPDDISSKEIAGKGMLVETAGSTYLAGTAELLREHGLAPATTDVYGSIVHVAKDKTYLGYLAVSDTIKPEAMAAVQTLKGMSLKTVMLSGDREQNVAHVCAEVGIEAHKAELLPAEKVFAMQEITDPQSITFVGDGINDAPSLATARVGIAMGGIGSEVAIEAADAVILNDSPVKIAELYRIAQRVRTIVWQNIVMALGIKGVFMVFGVAGLSGLWEAVFADVGVALLAVLNSVRVMRD